MTELLTLGGIGLIVGLYFFFDKLFSIPKKKKNSGFIREETHDLLFPPKEVKKPLDTNSPEQVTNNDDL
ncbi:MAG TPA: hypothetical protein VD794_05735 [Flavisolibacter sp.]|nr:hypothetical protein [Flavisolibacter sp.]